VIDDQKITVLTTTCGTPGYMAPEIFKKEGHNKPVDIWAIGVITYFLLCGYTPFDRNSNIEEIQAICAADYAFEPKEYWQHVSDTARDFIRHCLTIDQTKRPTAHQLLAHPWLKMGFVHGVVDPDSLSGETKNLLPSFQAQFDAKKMLRKAIWSVRFANSVRKGAELTAEENRIKMDVDEGKKMSEEEHVHHGHHVFYASS